MIRVLSTKKLERRLVEEAHGKEIEVQELAFISVQPIISDEIFRRIFSLLYESKINTVVFTSANAVEALELNLHGSNTILDCDIFCLSGKTKRTIGRSDFLKKNIVGEADNASALAKKIIEKGVQEIIFFCGDLRRNELPDALEEAGVSMHEVVVYQTLTMPEETGEKDAVLFFSPSAVHGFFSANQLNSKAVCFAIGATTAKAIREYTTNAVVVSGAPTQPAMMEILYDYFQNKKHYE